MNSNIKTAFTLVELLVVIAIVGILSGLIIVGMSNSVQSANIAKAQIFSSSIRDSLLMDLVSEWKFDEGSGTTAKDSWNENNNGVFMDTGGACTTTLCPQWQTSGCVYDDCLSFNGTGAYINCGTGSTLNITSTITVEAWIKYSSASAWQTFVHGAAYNIGWGTSYWFASSPTNVRFSLAGTSTPYSDLTYARVTNKWHLFTGTYDGSNGKIYINGILLKTWATTGSITGVNGLTIGYADTTPFPFNGSMDQIRIYDVAIPASQIKEHYYAGLNNLLAKGEIDEEEYKEGIINE